MLFLLADTDTNTMIIQVVTLLTPVLLGYIALRQQMIKTQQDKAILGVKEDLATADSKKYEKLDNIKKLVDGNLTEQMRETTDAKIALASVTGDPKHIDAANKCVEDLTRHVMNQNLLQPIPKDNQ